MTFFLMAAERPSHPKPRQTATYFHTIAHIYGSKGLIWFLDTLKTSLYTVVIFKWVRVAVHWRLLPTDDRKWPITPSLLLYEVFMTFALEPLDIAFTQKLVCKSPANTLQRLRTFIQKKSSAITILRNILCIRITHMVLIRTFGIFVPPKPHLGWVQPMAVLLCQFWAYSTRVVFITQAQLEAIEPTEPTVVPIIRDPSLPFIRKFIWSQGRVLRLLQELATFLVTGTLYFGVSLLALLLSSGHLMTAWRLMQLVAAQLHAKGENPTPVTNPDPTASPLLEHTEL
jgi:hypothetical protein